MGKKIIVVDDEPHLTFLCKMVLEDEGFTVDAYTDSLSAFSDYKPDNYDLLLLDIKMPNMDGFELHRKVKELDNAV